MGIHQTVVPNPVFVMHKNPRGASGFSLVEAMVALTLLLGLSGALLSTLAQSEQLSTSAEGYSQAKQTAQQFIENARRMPFGNLYACKGDYSFETDGNNINGIPGGERQSPPQNASSLKDDAHNTRNTFKARVTESIRDADGEQNSADAALLVSVQVNWNVSGHARTYQTSTLIPRYGD